MGPIREKLLLLAALAGLGVPTLFTWMAWELTGSPVRTVLAITVAALLNIPFPLGGGMGAQGVTRVRLVRWEWTFDADRSLGEGVLGSFLLAAVTSGGFFLAALLVAAALRWTGPLRTGLDEVLALAAVVLLVALAWLLHRPELPLGRVRAQLESTSAPEELARAVQALARIAREDGAIGHVGGIGAGTVGLHEHLEAEALLRLAAARGTPGAATLHARCLEHLQSRAEPGGGFSSYPGGLARVEYTARSLEALRERLDEAAVARHRTALLACRRADGSHGRSIRGPASAEATAWARRALGEEPVASPRRRAAAQDVVERLDEPHDI